MLYGEARHSIDAKNRLFIPAAQRDELGSTFMAVRALREKCVRLYSMEQWEQFANDIKTQLKDDGEKRAKVSRYLYSLAAQLTPDAQGRVLLPARLVEYTGIQKNVMILGCGDYAEIWSEEAYEKLKADLDVSKLLAELEELGL